MSSLFVARVVGDAPENVTECVHVFMYTYGDSDVILFHIYAS